MPNKTYASGTVIDSASLNDFNDATYEILGDGTNPAATKAQARTNLGLGNVDNTSDVNKPVSTAQTAAIAAAVAPKANTASPALTGNPTAPTPAYRDNDTSIATTAHVIESFGAGGSKFGPASTVAMPTGVNPITFSTVTASFGGAGQMANGRFFQPTKAGWYFISASCSITGVAAASDVFISLYLNDAIYARGSRGVVNAGVVLGLTIGNLVYLNGTTDYCDVRIYSGAATSQETGQSFFNAFLANPGL